MTPPAVALPLAEATKRAIARGWKRTDGAWYGPKGEPFARVADEEIHYRRPKIVFKIKAGYGFCPAETALHIGTVEFRSEAGALDAALRWYEEQDAHGISQTNGDR